ncbi:MAG TPA: hypothetical protein VHT70_02550 [Candidatus Saccharimonadales bacterium]|jgi:hypothetical protein|nr:hypothetical protein [Candidatus Saccharimonadales bacterium]
MEKRMFLAEGGRIRTRALLMIAGILAVVFVGGMIFVSIYNKSHTPERLAANTFVKYITSDDAASSYNMFSNRMKKSFDKTSWQTFVTLSYKNYKGKATFVSKTPVSNPVPTYGKTADPQRIVYAFNASNGGRSYKQYVIMVYENNKWEVDEIGNA